MGYLIHKTIVITIVAYVGNQINQSTSKTRIVEAAELKVVPQNREGGEDLRLSYDRENMFQCSL